MYTINTMTPGGFLGSAWSLALGVMALDPAAFQAVQNNASATWLTLVVLFGAGVSQTLGQSVMLLVNRVSPWRFFLSVLVAGTIFILSAVVYVSTIWLLLRFAFHINVPILVVIRTVTLAYAPLLLSFGVLLPYAGSLFGHMLDIWSLLAMLLAVSVIAGLGFWPALFCVLGGWLLFEAIKFTIGRPLLHLTGWLKSGVAGVPLSARPRDLTELMRKNLSDRPGER